MSQFGGGHQPRAHRMQKEKLLVRLEKHILRGITNQSELSAAFGVSKSHVCEYIEEVYERWRNQAPKDLDTQRLIRVKQLDSIAVMALNEFDRSRRDGEDISITSRMCVTCGGEGQDEVHPGELVKCHDCNGVGRIVVETVRVRGRQGDPSFLTVAKSCIEAASRLQGLYPETVKIGRSSLIEEARLVGGIVQRSVQELYYEAPIDLIIRAKATLDQLKAGVAKGDVVKVDKIS